MVWRGMGHGGWSLVQCILLIVSTISDVTTPCLAVSEGFEIIGHEKEVLVIK